jgi:Flp pilus assembly protein TadD
MRRTIAPALALALGVVACTTAQQPGPSREETVIRSFQARVEAIDHEARLVTLLDASGEKLVFRADEGVRNLAQVKPGDVLAGDLVENLLIEARAATETEKAAPASLVEALAAAQPGQKPAGLFVRQVKELFTIAGGTLRDTDGQLHFVKARDPAVLDRLRVGDTVVVTYTQALRLQVLPGS